MRLSTLFTKTRKEAPSDEISKNAKLLIRAGYIHKDMAGVYSFLPLGLRVLNNVVGIIRDEMNRVGGQELFLSSLQSKEVWDPTARWSESSVDAWFKTRLQSGAELGLAFTHEEPLTALMRDHIQSFRDLPRYVYQFQTKFRNEARAKSGIMRAREFLMKDLYSFSRDEKEHQPFYNSMIESYLRIFARAGIGEKTYLTYASGGSFSKYSHEFQTVTDAGEDTIHICDDCSVAINEEIAEGKPTCPKCGKTSLRKETAVEVGNIFTLGTRFSDALSLHYIDEKNEKKPVFMGSYGIGPGRLIGTIVELLSDEKGIVWPVPVAPYPVHIVAILDAAGMVTKAADALYAGLEKQGIEALYDDRDARAGEKFGDADLVGIPIRITVSSKTIEKGMYEVTDRKTGASSHMTEVQLAALLSHDTK